MTAPNWRNRILAADLVWGMIAMLLAYLLRYGWVWYGPEDGKKTALVFFPPLVVALVLWFVISNWQRMDGFRGGWRFSALLSHLLLGIATLMAFLLAVGFLLREYISRLAMGYFGVLLFIGFVAIRCIVRLQLASGERSGHVRRVAIVGNGNLAAQVAYKIQRHPELRWHVVGFLNPEDATLDGSLAGGPTDRVGIVNVAELLRSRNVDEVILAVPKPGHPEILDLTSRCLAQKIGVSVVPQPYELYLSKPELLDVDGLPLLHLQATVAAGTEPVWKRTLDLALTACLLPIGIPLMLAGATLLKVRKGKGFCRDQRCGKNGEAFWMFRLNSIRHIPGLPRYEVLLQELGITELPQLFNVVTGQMSLVGPRPEGFDRARHYTEWHRQRLLAKPGITGLAQVHGLRYEHSSEDKTCYDLQYILHRSIFQDISLLVQTVWTLTGRIFHVPRSTPHSPAPPTPTTTDTQFQENFVHAHRSQPSTH